MSDATAIGMVSEALRNLLVGRMALSPAVEITVLAPDESAVNRRINLFLYKVQENPAFKNQDWQLKRGSATVLAPPPLSLNLFYLMTPYAPNDAQTGNSTAHAILGDAMRVFHENPVIPKDHLPDGLLDAAEQIQIFPNTLDMEELARVWSTFTQPFRLSVFYQITVVQIDAAAAGERLMAPRVREIGKPRVDAPFAAPWVESVVPLSGKAGSKMTFNGTNLKGWKAYVQIAGDAVVDAGDLNYDSFEVTLPADLAPGFNQIRVDISHLFRRTFFFEVTP
jgi:hypothetical protein